LVTQTERIKSKPDLKVYLALFLLICFSISNVLEITGFILVEKEMPKTTSLDELSTRSGSICKDDSINLIIKALQEDLETAKRQIKLLLIRNAEIEKLAITDDLTGLYNQRHFHNELEQEVINSKNQKTPLCLLFFDVDGLKKYNDTYGHMVGNDVLKAIANSISDNIHHNSASGYRYGGDEFAVILTKGCIRQAVELAKMINKSLKERDFNEVTLSFGIAQLEPDMDSKTLFKRADDAMYKAKKMDYDGCIDKIYIYNKNEVTWRENGKE
jgi:diguanylate cyclase